MVQQIDQKIGDAGIRKAGRSSVSYAASDCILTLVISCTPSAPFSCPVASSKFLQSYERLRAFANAERLLRMEPLSTTAAEKFYNSGGDIVESVAGAVTLQYPEAREFLSLIHI